MPVTENGTPMTTLKISPAHAFIQCDVDVRYWRLCLQHSLNFTNFEFRNHSLRRISIWTHPGPHILESRFRKRLPSQLTRLLNLSGNPKARYLSPYCW